MPAYGNLMGPITNFLSRAKCTRTIGHDLPHLCFANRLIAFDSGVFLAPRVACSTQCTQVSITLDHSASLSNDLFSLCPGAAVFPTPSSGLRRQGLFALQRIHQLVTSLRQLWRPHRVMKYVSCFLTPSRPHHYVQHNLRSLASHGHTCKAGRHRSDSEDSHVRNTQY